MPNLEILTIGDELVEGRLVDTNSGFLSTRLVEAGFQVTRHVSVGDDIDDMVAALREAASRADAVLISGGLGPTTDDLTAEAAGKAFGRPVVLFEEALEHTRSMFARMGRTMTPNNEKQAWLPEASTLIMNARGTACGFHLDADRARLYFMPGVPHEMKAMFEGVILPDLKGRLKPRPVRVSGFKTFGLGESKVGSLLEDLKADAPGELFIQYRAAFPEVHVRLCLTGFEPDDARGDAELERLTDEAARRLGHAIFTRGNESLPEVVLKLLKERQATLGAAESCTGGLLSGLLTSIPGSSEAFEGGVVSYSNTLKQSLLGVPAELLEAHGAVSREVAEAMAAGARERLGTTWALSITGVAGPGGGSAEKPVGTVWLGIAGPGGVFAKHAFFAGDRDRVRNYSAYSALEMLRRALEGRAGTE